LTASTTGDPWIFGSPTTRLELFLSHSINLSHGLYLSVCVTVCRRKENEEMGRGEIRPSGVCRTEERGRKEKEGEERKRKRVCVENREKRGKEKKVGEDVLVCVVWG
jgi:hypothetical protein